MTTSLAPPLSAALPAATPAASAAAPGRLAFANQLRGIAAVLVLMTHLFGTYFVAPGFVTNATFSTDLQLVEPGWVSYLHPSFSGPFGVALFFMISGFVIPFSLAGASPLRFLVARFFRIIPTYAVALAIAMLALYLSAQHWGNSFTHGARQILANAFLVHYAVGMESIDPVNWSLSVEIKFYLLMALAAPLLVRRSFVPCAVFLAAALGVAACSDGLPWVAAMMALELNYLIFMMIGVGFYLHLHGVIDTRALVLRSAVIFAAFAFSWAMGPQKAQFPGITQYYLYALLTFALAYALRGRFRPMRMLDFLADISYPLYALHSLTGWALLKALMGQGMGFLPAIVLTVAAIVGASYLIHVAVEKPSNRLGKRLARAALGVNKA